MQVFYVNKLYILLNSTQISTEILHILFLFVAIRFYLLHKLRDKKLYVKTQLSDLIKNLQLSIIKSIIFLLFILLNTTFPAKKQ